MSTVGGGSDRSGRVPVEPATIWPRAAVAMMRRHREEWRGLAAALEAHPHPRSQAAGRELRWSLASMQRAEVEQRARDSEAAISGVGSAEVPSESGRGSLVAPPGSRLTVGQVAGMLGVGERQVRNLCHGELSATKPGGVWMVDPDSVEALMLRRNS